MHPFPLPGPGIKSDLLSVDEMDDQLVRAIEPGVVCPSKMRDCALELGFGLIEVPQPNCVHKVAAVVEKQDWLSKRYIQRDKVHPVMADDDGLAIIGDEQPAVPARD